MNIHITWRLPAVVLAVAARLFGGIYPSALEVNLGPTPIDAYTWTNSGNQYLPASWCSAASTVRSCYQTLFAAYHNQGVTGVRFQFGLMGGANSTAFTPTGGTNPAWISNLSLFFYDLHNAGIQSLTPTPVTVDTWTYATPPSWTTVSRHPSCPANPNDPTPNQLLFYPWLPFGLERYNSAGTIIWPDGSGVNGCYYYSTQNPGFWGWGNLTNLLRSVINTANSNGLPVEEVDLQNEVSVFAFPVMARLIYDNTTNTPVRTSMALSSPLTVSVSAAYPSAPGDCGSVYGDSALLMNLSEVIAATAGYAFGQPPSFTWNGSLACSANSDVTGMLYVPAQPISTVLDIH